MKNWLPCLVVLAVVSCSSPNQYSQKLTYPEARTVDSTDIYFGDTIPDPYRWLENDTSANTKAWIDKENDLTASFMGKIPYLDSVKKEIKEQVNYAKMSAPGKHGAYYYYYRNTGLQNQDVLYRSRMPSDTSSAELFLDPNTFAHNGYFSLQGTSFTQDGKYMAYSLSEGGADWEDVIIKDATTLKAVGDTIKDVKFTGITWKGDEGFYYATYDIPGGGKLLAKTEHHKLYYHKLNTPQADDMMVFGGNKEPHRYIGASVTEDGHYLEITGANTTSGNDLYLQDLTIKNAPIVPVVTDMDKEQYIIDNRGSTLFIFTNRNAPNYRLVKVDAAKPGPENWTDVIPETKDVLEVHTGGGYFFAEYMVDVKDQVVQFDETGKKLRDIQLPAAGTVSGFDGDHDQQLLFYAFTSFTYPSTVYSFDSKTGTSTLLWKPNLKFNPDDYVTEQVFYRSKDSTKIPMYIVHKKGLKMDGKNPTYLYAYGGFNVSLMPAFSSYRMEWLEHGGIFAQPNLRGGGEYGENWHLAGTKMHKQNVFDDFIAAAEYLINHQYTSSDYLAIAGGSNGGLLVGATMTQRPDLMRVAMPGAGVLDMLRYHKFTAGAGWAYDYGTADDSKEMFQYLLSYSPLQNVRKGESYPATYVWTADHDDRVVPGHSFKFTATLQADQAGNAPVIIKVAHNIGHGTGLDTDKYIDYYASQYCFSWYNMGVNPLK